MAARKSQTYPRFLAALRKAFIAFKRGTFLIQVKTQGSRLKSQSLTHGVMRAS
jgi:hypothetical protein